MASIQIIVGSVMGTAQGVADYLHKELSAQHTVEVNNSASSADLVRNADELLLFCTSNTGSGDLPENIVPVYNALRTEFPNIAYRKYGLINLGDSSYPTFGEAGRLLDEALLDIGAQRLGDILTIDACADRYPQKTALSWTHNLLKAFEN